VSESGNDSVSDMDAILEMVTVSDNDSDSDSDLVSD